MLVKLRYWKAVHQSEQERKLLDDIVNMARPNT